jgi:hypothetical protein
MKRVTPVSVLLFAALVGGATHAHATEVGTARTFGLGVQLLDPTAIIGKVFLDRNNALDFGIGFWNYGHCYDSDGRPYYCDSNHTDVSLHFDYLYEEPIIDQVVRLDWHAGVGGRLVFWGYENDRHHDGVTLLARVPVGLDVAFRRPRWLEAYLEVAPALVVIPPLDFAIDVGLGARAYF